VGGAQLLARAAVAGVDMHDPTVQSELAEKAKRLPPAPPQRDFVPSVYFIRCGRFVKIGTTVGSVERRFNGMQPPPDAEIVAVMTGHGRATELELHKRFHASRVRGEWFTSTPELESLIETFAYRRGVA
jgi:Meiotically Up-regulated Gene 113 (MUG113) protein